MCRLLSENPAKLYGVYPQKGAVAPGSDADIVVWNPDIEWTMSVENQVANVDYCPFEGTKVKGKAELVFLKGELAAKGRQGRGEDRGLRSEKTADGTGLSMPPECADPGIERI